jgi:hypothetical protein
MHIPAFLIAPCFLAAFALFCWQYYVGNPDSRLTDHRFLLAAGTLALALIYVALNAAFPALTGISVLFFAVAAALLVLSVLMTRRSRRKPVSD